MQKSVGQGIFSGFSEILLLSENSGRKINKKIWAGNVLEKSSTEPVGKKDIAWQTF